MEKEKTKEEKEDVEEADVYITEDQMEKIKLLQEELKRLKGKKLVEDKIDNLHNQIKTLEKTKQPKSKLLQSYIRLLKKGIAWWNMEGLSETEKAAKRKKFADATNSLFGGDNSDMGEIPPLFDDFDGESKTPMGFFDELQPKTTRKPRNQPKSVGKQHKSSGSKQKATGKHKKKRKSQSDDSYEEDDEEEQPFFNLWG